MDEFEQKEMEKNRTIKDTIYDWLINYIHRLIRKNVGNFQDKVVSPFETKAPKNYGKKTVLRRERKQANQKHKSNQRQNN